MSPRCLRFALALIVAASASAAEDVPTPGHVQIPVDVYARLLEASRDPSRIPRGAPAGYALGNARVALTVQSASRRASGGARVELAVDGFEDRGVLVPGRPAGTPLESATASRDPVPLVP